MRKSQKGSKTRAPRVTTQAGGKPAAGPDSVTLSRRRNTSRRTVERGPDGRAIDAPDPSTIPLIPQPHGGALRRGNPGCRASPGRPPDEFKRRMQAIASAEEVLEALETVSKSPSDPNWLAAVKFAAERGYGKPEQTTTHEAGESLSALITESWRSAS